MTKVYRGIKSLHIWAPLVAVIAVVGIGGVYLSNNTVGSEAAVLPLETIYVAEGGSDKNDGATKGAPVRTLTRAIALASTSGNLVAVRIIGDRYGLDRLDLGGGGKIKAGKANVLILPDSGATTMYTSVSGVYAETSILVIGGSVSVSNFTFVGLGLQLIGDSSGNIFLQKNKFEIIKSSSPGTPVNYGASVKARGRVIANVKNNEFNIHQVDPNPYSNAYGLTVGAHGNPGENTQLTVSGNKFLFFPQEGTAMNPAKTLMGISVSKAGDSAVATINDNIFIDKVGGKEGYDYKPREVLIGVQTWGILGAALEISNNNFTNFPRFSHVSTFSPFKQPSGATENVSIKSNYK